MKETIIIIIILILIFLGDYLIAKYLDNTSTSLVSKLDSLENNIIKLEESNSEGREKITKEIEDVKEEWNTIEEIWAIIVLHQEIDNIEISLLKLESEIKYGELYEALEELSTAKFLVHHIEEKEKFNFKNIF